jgi:hypothetical protein
LAKLCYFYGWTPQIVEGFDTDEVEKYWQLITRIEAQEMLKQLTIQDWPNLKKDKRSSLHRKLHRDAYPVQQSITLEDYIKNTGGGLGG